MAASNAKAGGGNGIGVKHPASPACCVAGWGLSRNDAQGYISTQYPDELRRAGCSKVSPQMSPTLFPNLSQFSGFWMGGKPD